METDWISRRSFPKAFRRSVSWFYPSARRTFTLIGHYGGARGYVMKSEATENVLTAIRSVIRGEVYVSRLVAARAFQNLFPDPVSTQPELAKLSDRELQVFQLIGAGCSNREVSAILKISTKTV